MGGVRRLCSKRQTSMKSRSFVIIEQMLSIIIVTGSRDHYGALANGLTPHRTL